MPRSRSLSSSSNSSYSSAKPYSKPNEGSSTVETKRHDGRRLDNIENYIILDTNFRVPSPILLGIPPERRTLRPIYWPKNKAWLLMAQPEAAARQENKPEILIGEGLTQFPSIPDSLHSGDSPATEVNEHGRPEQDFDSRNNTSVRTHPRTPSSQLATMIKEEISSLRVFAPLPGVRIRPGAPGTATQAGTPGNVAQPDTENTEQSPITEKNRKGNWWADFLGSRGHKRMD
ncbi:hypothetical protein F4805DRAFT_475743 [Annulohypoxylon moriforme]|nr:hypothetical protein F4805DRAFT_475743 [Annulohypoxylon moriforme]